MPYADDDGSDDLKQSPAIDLRHLSVTVDCHGERLDRALSALVPEFSRSYLQQLIEDGFVCVNEQKIDKVSSKVKAADRITIDLKPTPQSLAFKPEKIPIEVVFEDEFLLVINKPAGLVVHPAPGNWTGTLLNGLLARDDAANLMPRAGIVHRLDKDTSGLMVVARQRQTMDQLVGMIAARAVTRQYTAIAHGVWLGDLVKQVKLPIGRDPKNRLRMAVVDLQKQSGKEALTEFECLQNGLNHCLVRCKLGTGRTHQIRVHMAHLKHSLVGDQVYGGRQEAGLTRQGLHASYLAFAHPSTRLLMTFSSDLPPDMVHAVSELGLGYNEEEFSKAKQGIKKP